jgi:hypothetical protein
MTFWNGLAAVHRPEAPALAAARNRPDFSLTAYWRDRLASAQTIPESDPNWQSVTAAIAAAHAGDTPRALQWLERAASRRVDQLIFAAVHPAFKDLHGEPRFEAILERIGLGRWSARDRKDDGK